MEPGHEDREYLACSVRDTPRERASMEPGHEDREYAAARPAGRHEQHASMEPGHEDREYSSANYGHGGKQKASMEPGHEDREYSWPRACGRTSVRPPQWSPVMKTGNTPPPATRCLMARSLNGARS